MDLIRFSGFRYAFYLFCITDLFSLLQPFVRLKSIQHYAKKNGIPIYHTQDINDDAGVAYLQSLTPDILLSAYFNQRIKATILSLPKQGCLNIHPSLLPAYRGVDPVFYAMLRSETNVGVTLHRLDEEFDTGNIIEQQPYSRELHRSLFYYYSQLFVIGSELATTQITEGKEQREHEGYDSWPSKEDLRLFFKNRGKLLIIKDYFHTLHSLK